MQSRGAGIAAGSHTADEIRDALAQAGSAAGAARILGVPVTTLQARMGRMGITSPHPRSPHASAAVSDGDTIESVLPAHPKRESARDPETVVREHGYDPEAFALVSVSDNYWRGNDGEGPAILTQSKAVLKPRTASGLIAPPRTDAPLKRKRHARRDKAAPILVALPADQHAPHHHEGLHACWLAWNRHNRPDRRVNLGDLAQYSKPSRWAGALNPEWQESAAESGQAGHDWWRDTIAAWDGAEDEQIPGNHDLRPSIYCESLYPDAYNIRRPGEPHPWHDAEYLLGLDQLGVKYHRPGRSGDYWVSKVEVAPGLWVHHGVKAGKHGGALKDIERHETSRAQGHDHKQAITYVVRYRGDEPHQHVAVSVGTMSRRDKAHNADADINLGFGTVVIWPNGYWNVELARYDDRRDVLVWRDQMYTP